MKTKKAFTKTLGEANGHFLAHNSTYSQKVPYLSNLPYSQLKIFFLGWRVKGLPLNALNIHGVEAKPGFPKDGDKVH